MDTYPDVEGDVWIRGENRGEVRLRSAMHFLPDNKYYAYRLAGEPGKYERRFKKEPWTLHHNENFSLLVSSAVTALWPHAVNDQEPLPADEGISEEQREMLQSIPIEDFFESSVLKLEPKSAEDNQEQLDCLKTHEELVSTGEVDILIVVSIRKLSSKNIKVTYDWSPKSHVQHQHAIACAHLNHIGSLIFEEGKT